MAQTLLLAISHNLPGTCELTKDDPGLTLAFLASIPNTVTEITTHNLFCFIAAEMVLDPSLEAFSDFLARLTESLVLSKREDTVDRA